MSNYGSLDTKSQKCMCNTSRDIIRNFAAVASENKRRILLSVTALSAFCLFIELCSINKYGRRDKSELGCDVCHKAGIHDKM